MFLDLSTFWSVVIIFFVFAPLLLLLLTPLVDLVMWSNFSAVVRVVELRKLADLRNEGVITDEEFARQKKKLLG
ncbi:MAG: SHOCT domain-containing protein [Chloroflexi bacterium]|nr:SHOCT domain-containing protein [Chloroflexota bacterium]